MNSRKIELIEIAKTIVEILIDQQDLRFGQLVANLSNPVDPFYISNKDLLNKLKEYKDKNISIPF